MRQTTLMELLALFAALSSLGCVFLWQGGRTERQQLAIEWEREKFKASQLAESKRWEDALKAVDELKAQVSKRCDETEATLKRFVDGRELIRKAG